MTTKDLLIFLQKYLLVFLVAWGHCLSPSTMKLRCDCVFDLTKHMPADRAYNMSGQTFLEPVNDLPLALSFCIRTCSVPVRLHHDGVTDEVTQDKPPATLG